jgi:hypothetical protein
VIKGEKEAAIMAAAHNLWRKTYGAGTEEHARAAVVQTLDRGGGTIHRTDERLSDVWGNAPELAEPPATPLHLLPGMGAMGQRPPSGGQLWVTSHDDNIFVHLDRLSFAVRWLHEGCVTLVTSHKFAAALASSTTHGADTLEDLPLPARAFRVEVPNGLFRSERYGVEYTQINVHIGLTGAATFMLEGAGPTSNPTGILVAYYAKDDRSERTMAEILGEQENAVVDVDRDGVALGAAETQRRMVILARRLVAGLLLTLAYTNHWQERGARGKRGEKRDPRGPPPHRIIFVGRPIQVDARPALARYLDPQNRPHGPPSLQSLVRGHHKRQVIGAGRSGRKVIWIEPYWRGPEDAPILARPLALGVDGQ